MIDFKNLYLRKKAESEEMLEKEKVKQLEKKRKRERYLEEIVRPKIQRDIEKQIANEKNWIYASNYVNDGFLFKCFLFIKNVSD